MPLIVCIETATEICSACAGDETGVLAIAEDRGPNHHASILTVLIDQVLMQAGRTVKEVDAVVVSKGPGSYTGLRVGVSTAKGLCYGLDKPLLSVNTLEAMANGFRASQPGLAENALLVPMLDARRMEVYCAVYDRQLNLVEPVAARIIDAGSFNTLPAERSVYFFGTGAAKCRDVIGHPGAQFVDTFSNSAAWLLGPALAAYARQQFEDVAYFEPFYLKDFVGTVPKRKA